jgi:hypothetical protein
MAMFGFGKRVKPQRTAPSAPPVVIELMVPKVQEPDPAPETLRRQLFAAAVSGDEEKLIGLCQKHKGQIFQSGAIWSGVSEKIRTNPTLMRWYISGLRTIVRVAADRMGQPELLQQVENAQTQPEPAETTK